MSSSESHSFTSSYVTTSSSSYQSQAAGDLQPDSTTTSSTTSTSNSTQSYTDASGNTVVRTVRQSHGQPAECEIRRFDSSGHEVQGSSGAGSGSGLGPAQAPAQVCGYVEGEETGNLQAPGQQGTGVNKVEDVSESSEDREYRERMEDEYAKREGGA